MLTTLRVDTEQNIQSLGPHGADVLGGEDSEQITLPYIRGDKHYGEGKSRLREIRSVKESYVIYKMVQEGYIDNQRPEIRKRASCAYFLKFSREGKSTCQSPEVGACVVDLRTNTSTSHYDVH